MAAITTHHVRGDLGFPFPPRAVADPSQLEEDGHGDLGFPFPPRPVADPSLLEEDGHGDLGFPFPPRAVADPSQLEEDGHGDLGFPFPPRPVADPSQQGIGMSTKYRLDEKDIKEKATSRYHEFDPMAILRSNIERRTWPKISTGEFPFELPRDPGRKTSEVIMVCRICERKDHRTSGCPYEDKGVVMERRSDKCVLVTNLSEDTCGADLVELFSVIDICRRVHVPLDESTGSCSGFGFVEFAESRRAKRVVMLFDGYRYKGRIIQVEWATLLKQEPNRSGDDMECISDRCVLVSNLSEETREADLMKLLRCVGLGVRVLVPMDEKTGLCRGFGFIEFANSMLARRVVILDGYRYNGRAMRVEWATCVRIGAYRNGADVFEFN
ncbi:hypothetical protein ACP4OV_000330 [Aristida adscensionis]